MLVVTAVTPSTKKLKCAACNLGIVSTNGDENSFNHSLIKGITRGSLLYPSADIAHVVLQSYELFKKLRSVTNFCDLILSVHLQLKQLWLYKKSKFFCWIRALAALLVMSQ